MNTVAKIATSFVLFIVCSVGATTEPKLPILEPASPEPGSIQRLTAYVGVIVLGTGLPIALAGSSLEEDRLTGLGLAILLSGVITISVAHYLCLTPDECGHQLRRQIWEALVRESKIFARQPELAGEESEFLAASRGLGLDVRRFAQLIAAIDGVQDAPQAAARGEGPLSPQVVSRICDEFFPSGLKEPYQRFVFGNLISLSSVR